LSQLIVFASLVITAGCITDDGELHVCLYCWLMLLLSKLMVPVCDNRGMVMAKFVSDNCGMVREKLSVQLPCGKSSSHRKRGQRGKVDAPQEDGVIFDPAGDACEQQFFFVKVK
jgi:hypothetical protein